MMVADTVTGCKKDAQNQFIEDFLLMFIPPAQHWHENVTGTGGVLIDDVLLACS